MTGVRLKRGNLDPESDTHRGKTLIYKPRREDWIDPFLIALISTNINFGFLASRTMRR